MKIEKLTQLGDNVNADSLPMSTLAEVNNICLSDEQFLSGDPKLSKVFKIVGSLSMPVPRMDQIFHYNACVECKKKVMKDNNGRWFCEKCNKAFVDCNMVYNFSSKIEDFTGMRYV